MTTTFQELAGCYRLVVTDDLLAFIERVFVAPAPEHERSKVRAEACAEAAAAELEILPDGTLVSRAGSREFYRARLPIPSLDNDLVFEKAPGCPVTLKIHPDGSLIALQPNRPPATFRRSLLTPIGNINK